MQPGNGQSHEPGVEPTPERPPTSEVSWLSFPGGCSRWTRSGAPCATGPATATPVGSPTRACGSPQGGQRRGRHRGTAYRYRVPLVGRSEGTLEVIQRHRPPTTLTGVVVTSPQPPTDPVEGARLFPLSGQLAGWSLTRASTRPGSPCATCPAGTATSRSPSTARSARRRRA
ncbi:hypothetical protein NKG94_28495 [Micromonospora sp. M12]